MNEPTREETYKTEPAAAQPEDHWARPVGQLSQPDAPKGALNINVGGRQLTGPLQGFGQMWQKTYRIRLTGAQVSPEETIRVWKENFPRFWPPNATFYAPFHGLEPGEVALINASGPGKTSLMSTGVMVIYADDESFTFMTPEGHPFAGWVTFSAFEEEGVTVAQAQVLIRANDPLYELGFRLGYMHRAEDQVWHHTLQALATHLGVKSVVSQKVTCVDSRVQWSQAKNVFKNAGLRTALYTLTAPFRWVQRPFRR